MPIKLRTVETNRFKKSIKKYKHNKSVLAELEGLLFILENQFPIPQKYRDHQLSGKFKGIRELHLQPDTLLLYFTVTEDGILKLYDIGTHSDIFK